VEAGTVVLRVRDNGRFTPTSYSNGIGIQSMRERAAELGGTFSIQPIAGNGTHLEVRLPLTTIM
jgi:signal transduction histidine kinase